MRIAATYENGKIFPHFGRTENFKIYDIEDNRIIDTQVVGTGGQGHGALAGVLSALKVEALICGGIGLGAQLALAEAGIKIYGGVSGKADDAVNNLLKGTLDYSESANCDHHHGGEHRCGENGSCH